MHYSNDWGVSFPFWFYSPNLFSDLIYWNIFNQWTLRVCVSLWWFPNTEKKKTRSPAHYTQRVYKWPNCWNGAGKKKCLSPTFFFYFLKSRKQMRKTNRSLYDAIVYTGLLAISSFACSPTCIRKWYASFWFGRLLICLLVSLFIFR